MIDKLIEDLKSDEGWEPSAYQDHLGFWTIGWGFLIDERKNGEIPVDVAEVWFRKLVDDKLAELYARHPWVGSQPEDVQRALTNMAYQLGIGGLSNFNNMLNALKSGDRQLAATEALDSRWAIQTPQRAQRVAALIRGTT